MGAGAESQPVAGAPVDEIVPAGLAGPGMVRDLVGREAGLAQHVLGQLEEPGLGLVVGHHEAAGGMEGVKPGPGLDRQLVEREMAGPKSQRPGQLGPPGSGVLPGPGIDQVERDPWEGRQREVEGRQGLNDTVLAAEEGEGGRIKSLDAERDAVDAGLAKGPEPGGLDRGRVGLKRDLDRLGRWPVMCGRAEDRGDGLGRHERRGAAAEEDRGERPARGLGRQPLELGEQGAPPAGGVDAVADMAVEVAIGAFGPAERPVHVEGEAVGRGRRRAIRTGHETGARVEP